MATVAIHTGSSHTVESGTFAAANQLDENVDIVTRGGGDGIILPSIL
jgi:hypothetical protein